MGRCGWLLAAQHYRVRADVTVLSKALGGGLPLAAVLMSDEAARGLAPGQHGCTFGGGPAVTSAGLHVLERVRRPGFLARVRARGRSLEKGLEALAQRHSTISEARGLGLLRAVVVADSAPFDAPALVKAFQESTGEMQVRGGERAVRLIPPLTVSPGEIEEALARLDRALHHLEDQAATKGEKKP